MKIRNLVGIGKFKVVATSGKERAEESVELDVRNPNPYTTNVIEKTLEPGGSWNAPFSPVGMAGTNTGVLEVSTIPALNLEKRLKFLIQYPHGCVEQTTSGVFPQLSLSTIMDLSDKQKAEVDHNIKAGINRLKGFQTTDGGLSYWPGTGTADEWGTNYAGHFMLEAQAKGYTLPRASWTVGVNTSATKPSAGRRALTILQEATWCRHTPLPAGALPHTGIGRYEQTA